MDTVDDMLRRMEEDVYFERTMDQLEAMTDDALRSVVRDIKPDELALMIIELLLK